MIRVKLSSARDEFLWPPPSIPRAKRAGDLCFNDALHSCLEPVKMFGFHKSKIYRSNEGCCICKTKSSSSRFTDSSRYEENFSLCFGWVFSPDTAPIPNIPRGMLVEFLSQFGASPNESSRESAGWAHWIRNSIFIFILVMGNTISVKYLFIFLSLNRSNQFCPSYYFSVFHIVVCLVVCPRIGLETSAMLVCCWWNAGRNYHMDQRKTGTM